MERRFFLWQKKNEATSFFSIHFTVAGQCAFNRITQRVEQDLFFFCFIKEKSRYIFLPNFLLQSQSFFFSKKAPRKSRQRQPPAVYKKTSESLTAPSVAVESPAGPVQWPKPLQRFSFVLRFAFFVSFRRALLPPNNNNNNNNNHPAMVVEIE